MDNSMLGVYAATILLIIIGISSSQEYEDGITKRGFCQGKVLFGGYCGDAYINSCCGMMKCQYYNQFRNQWQKCPEWSWYRQCQCLLPGGGGNTVAQKTRQRQYKTKYDPCQGKIPQGQSCTDNPGNCCNRMRCLQHNWKPCPTYRAQKYDCKCMP